MSLLTAVEYITSDPARRIGLYRLFSSCTRSEFGGMGQDGVVNIDSSVVKDLDLLERRARAEGFRV
jgi:hypothetical protein